MRRLALALVLVAGGALAQPAPPAGVNDYPTSARATGVGIASAVGRLGAVLSSFTGVISLDLGGPLAFFGVVSLLMILCGVAGWAARAKAREA